MSNAIRDVTEQAIRETDILVGTTTAASQMASRRKELQIDGKINKESPKHVSVVVYEEAGRTTEGETAIGYACLRMPNTRSPAGTGSKSAHSTPRRRNERVIAVRPGLHF